MVKSNSTSFCGWLVVPHFIKKMMAPKARQKLQTLKKVKTLKEMKACRALKK